MLNKWIGIGRLVADPEVKYTTNGKAVASFKMAVERNFKNAQGEREADFLPVVVWNQLGELVGKYLSKGRLVAVSGRIQTRSYETDNGKRYITEIVADEVQFLERKQEQDKPQGGFEPMDGEDPDLPF